MIAFNPHDWYWLAEDGRLFSSKREEMVNDDDPEYLEWKQNGGSPTHWPKDWSGNKTKAALREVLAPYKVWQVPVEISPRQVILGLLQEGLITEGEALAAAKNGDMPEAVQAVVDELPPADQVAAQITWARMVSVERDNPLVIALAQSAGKTDDEIDQFFMDWGRL